MINKSKILKDVQKFIAKSQWDKAIIEYEKLLADSPNDANTFNTVGDLSLKRNDTEKAIESFKKAAEIFIKTGFTLKAIALYKKVLNIKPDQVDIFLLMGKLNAERGMVGNANENYLAAASYFTKQGQKNKAIDIYKTLCELNPDNFSLAQKLMELYMGEGFEREGINKCIELAEKKVEQNDLAGAREFLARVEKKAGDRFEFIRVSALIDLKENKLFEAVSKLEEVNKLDPNDERVLLPLGEAYLRSGRYEESSEVYKVLLEKNPKHILYRLQLIDLDLKIGDFDSAWKEYAALAEWHISQKEFVEAEKFIREFITHRKDNEALKFLADILEKQGRQDEAEAARREAEEVLNKPSEPAPSDTLPAAPEAPPVEKIPPIEDEAPVEEISADEPNPVEEEIALPEISLGEESKPGPYQPEEFQPESSEISQPEISFSEPEGPLPEIPEELGELPPMDMEEDDALAEIPHDLGSEGILEDSEIDGIDVFAINKGIEETSAADETGIQSGPGDGIPDIEETVLIPEKSFEERLDEVDVLLRYGMTEKVTDILNSLSTIRPQDPELKKRYLELYKAQGDLDSFVDVSIELAGIYTSIGMEAEAESVLAKARRLDPGNPNLASIHEGPPAAVYEIAADDMPAPGLEAESDIFSEMSMQVPPMPELLPEIDELPLPEPPPDIDELPLPGPVQDIEELSISEPLPDAEEISLPDPLQDIEEPPLPEMLPDEFADYTPADLEDISAHTMTPGSVHYLEERAEADFYAQQGLTQEAIDIYKRLLSVNPDDIEIKTKLDSLEPVLEQEEPIEAARPEPLVMEEKSEEDEIFNSLDSELEQAFKDTWDEPAHDEIEPVDASPGPEEYPEPASAALQINEPEPEEAFFDLGAELREEFKDEPETEPLREPTEVFEDKLLEEVFQEFKKGVEEQLNTEDYETHYNLGIAYKEMGMLDEALGEFELASRDTERLLDCASMRGLCYIEKGDYDAAIKNFKEGLKAEGRGPDEYRGLKYDLAAAYELKGDIPSAQSLVEEIFSEDPEFRDIKEKLQRLNKTLLDSGATPAAKDKKKTETKPAPKKSKVSYL